MTVAFQEFNWGSPTEVSVHIQHSYSLPSSASTSESWHPVLAPTFSWSLLHSVLPPQLLLCGDYALLLCITGWKLWAYVEKSSDIQKFTFSVNKLKFTGQLCVYQGTLKEAVFPLPLLALPPQPD